MILLLNAYYVSSRCISRSEYSSYLITLASPEGGACELRCSESVFNHLSSLEPMKIYSFECQYNPAYKNQLSVVGVSS